MSVISIQVHLPSFSQSFNVSLSSHSTIIDLKNEISRVCVGSPKVEGQRVIYKGRVLDDTEVVGQVWKATDVPHTCHLAVHPSAWTSAPPNIIATPPLPSFSPPNPPLRRAGPPTNTPPNSATTPSPPPQVHATYSYIQYLHTNALRILAGQPRLSWPDQLGDLISARAFAKRGVEATGRGWPSYLNQDFPLNIPERGPDEGVKYVNIYIDNLPYLSLSTPDATPTAIQMQAIRVLSYTFPLLCVYPLQTQQTHLLQVNAVPPRPLAALGLQFQGALPQLPIRPLILPLVLLTIRTTLLLYFFQPARKPFLGLIVLIWVVWEVISAVRGALGGVNDNVNGAQNNRAGGVDNANAGGAGGEAGGAGAVARAGAEARPGNNAVQMVNPNSQDAILDQLAQLNLPNEARFVEPDATPNGNAPPPTLLHQMKTFLILLLLTLHPALWDRRRNALRAREGRVREDARNREARRLQQERERTEREENGRRGIEETSDGDITTETPDTRPVPKPFWVAEYVQRVRSGDWVDD